MPECNTTAESGTNATPNTALRHPLEPSAQSVAARKRIAQLISPLRRVKPRVPFWELAAHRIPTLWGLYRCLLTNTNNGQIRWRIRKLFEKNKKLTGTAQTIDRLKMGYKWLDAFKKARGGDPFMERVLERYGRLIEMKRKKEHWKQVLRIELEWQEKLRRKPILTGSLLPATRDNKPMPRLYPQPTKFGAMFIERRRTRELRLARYRRNIEEAQDISREIEFEDGVRKLASTAGGANLHASDGQPPYEARLNAEAAFSRDTHSEWLSPVRAMLEQDQQSHARDEARLRSPITPEMVATMARARTHRILNKTHERKVIRQGLITNSVLKRKRQGPPSWILDRMTPEAKHWDGIVRKPSEGGYTGRLKAKMGVKMKEPGLWKKEEIVTEEGLRREDEIHATMRRIQEGK